MKLKEEYLTKVVSNFLYWYKGREEIYVIKEMGKWWLYIDPYKNKHLDILLGEGNLEKFAKKIDLEDENTDEEEVLGMIENYLKTSEDAWIEILDKAATELNEKVIPKLEEKYKVNKGGSAFMAWKIAWWLEQCGISYNLEVFSNFPVLADNINQKEHYGIQIPVIKKSINSVKGFPFTLKMKLPIDKYFTLQDKPFDVEFELKNSHYISKAIDEVFQANFPD